MKSVYALELKDLRRNYGSTKALDGLTIAVPEKSITAFVGANGAGKTTTFSIIGQFIKPLSGSIEVFGQSIKDYRGSGGLIGLLPQDMQYFEERTVARQLFLFAKLAGLNSRESQVEVERVLAQVNLQEKSNAKTCDLSHGMRVRLGVAQALIANPPLVLLDEPTAGLDPRMQFEFRETVKSLKGKTTLVISSHDLSQLQELCDYCCIIDRGRLLKQGSMNSILGEGASQKVRYRVGNKPPVLDGLEQACLGIRKVSEERDWVTIEFDQKNLKLGSVNSMIINWLSSKNIEVLEIEQMRDLEQTYLAVTSNKS